MVFFLVRALQDRIDLTPTTNFENPSAVLGISTCCKSIVIIVFANRYFDAEILRRNSLDCKVYVSISVMLFLVAEGKAKNRAVRITLEQYSSFWRSPVLLLWVLKTPSSRAKISVPKDFKKPFPSNFGPPRLAMSNNSFSFSYDLDASSPQLNFKSSFPRKAFLINGVHTYAPNSCSDIG